MVFVQITSITVLLYLSMLVPVAWCFTQKTIPNKRVIVTGAGESNWIDTFVFGYNVVEQFEPYKYTNYAH